MLGFAPSLRLGAGLAAPVRPELAEQVLAALREALSNAARHAGASQVEVTVDVDPDGILVVQVTDDGTGIPADARRSGLRNLARRAEKLGGELRLQPHHPGAPAPGTRLEWRVPRSSQDAGGLELGGSEAATSRRRLRGGSRGRGRPAAIHPQTVRGPREPGDQPGSAGQRHGGDGRSVSPGKSG
jgi:hypothetical protein